MNKEEFLKEIQEDYNKELEKKKLKWAVKNKIGIYEILNKISFQNIFKYKMFKGSDGESYPFYYITIELSIMGQIIEIETALTEYDSKEQGWFNQVDAYFNDEDAAEYELEGKEIYVCEPFKELIKKYNLEKEDFKQEILEIFSDIELAMRSFYFITEEENKDLENIKKEMVEFLGEDKIKKIIMLNNQFVLELKNGIKISSSAQEISKN